MLLRTNEKTVVCLPRILVSLRRQHAGVVNGLVGLQRNILRLSLLRLRTGSRKRRAGYMSGPREAHGVVEYAREVIEAEPLPITRLIFDGQGYQAAETSKKNQLFWKRLTQ